MKHLRLHFSSFPSPLPPRHTADTAQREQHASQHRRHPLSTYCCQYIGLRYINFQYGHRKWNNRALVENRCLNQSRSSFLRRTRFPARGPNVCGSSRQMTNGKRKKNEFNILLCFCLEDSNSQCSPPSVKWAMMSATTAVASRRFHLHTARLRK